MNENNEIYKSLGQVPELVKLAQNLIQNIENLSRMVAQAIQRQMTATIPEEEHQKMAQTISHTPCAAPDMTGVANELAKSLIKALRRDIHDEAVNAVKDAVKDTPVKVEKNIHYTSCWDMSHIADKALSRRFWIMFIITAVVLMGGLIGAFTYVNSDIYFGRQYEEICKSKYLTDEERKMLSNDTYYYGIIPGEFYDSPDLVKAKTKRNKQILRQRKAEAKANKGKFTTTIPLER